MLKRGWLTMGLPLRSSFDMNVRLSENIWYFLHTFLVCLTFGPHLAIGIPWISAMLFSHVLLDANWCKSTHFTKSLTAYTDAREVLLDAGGFILSPINRMSLLRDTTQIAMGKNEHYFLLKHLVYIRGFIPLPWFTWLHGLRIWFEYFFIDFE